MSFKYQKDTEISRRHFIKSSTLVTAFLAIPTSIYSLTELNLDNPWVPFVSDTKTSLDSGKPYLNPNKLTY
jgi:hypothetical protein